MTRAFTVTYTVTAAEAAAAAAVSASETHRGPKRSAGLALQALLGFAVVVVLVAARQSGELSVLHCVELGGVLGVLWIALYLMGRLRRRWPDDIPRGIVVGRCTLRVTARAIRWTHDSQSLRIKRPQVRDLQHDPLGLFVNWSGTRRLWIPQSLLSDLKEGPALVAALEVLSGRTEPPGDAPEIRGVFASLLRGYFQNLWAGLGCALLWPRRRATLDMRPGQWVALSLTIIASAAAVQYLLAEADSEFNLAGVPGLLFVIPVLMWAGGCAAALSGRADRLSELVTLGLATFLYTEPASAVLAQMTSIESTLGRVVPEDAVVSTLGATWLAVALGWALVLRTRRGILKSIPGLLASALLVGLILGYVPYDDTLWLPRADADPVPAASRMLPSDGARTAESGVLLEEDSKLLDAALAHLAAPRQDRVNLYFVGFAGTSAQDVFMKEVKSIDRLFAQRFEGADHSVLLINNPATIDSDPLATRTALARTLSRVGALMVPDRDILFLYMTSHGSPDHRFAVSFPPLHLNDIRPGELRRMLDEAGVRNRVVVVSACYSGAFVPALKSDYSLIMTAAAADRSSFGCSSEENFTYFGRAYFDEALRSTYSFIEAFRVARPKIAAREAAQGFVPSDPQIYIGKGIQPVLHTFQSQLTRESLP